MSVTIFFIENTRQLTVYQEKINLNRLLELLSEARNADPNNNLDLRSAAEKAAAPIPAIAVSKIKFTQCRFEKKIFTSNIKAIVTALENANAVTDLIFSKGCNIDSDIIKEFSKILLLVQSRIIQVTVEREALVKQNDFEIKFIPFLQLLLHEEWSKYFYQTWAIQLTGKASSELKNKVEKYNALVADINVWRFDFQIHNGACSIRMIVDGHPPFIAFINEQFSAWHEKGRALLNEMKRFIDEFKGAKNIEERNLAILLSDLREEVKDLIPHSRDANISSSEKHTYLRYAKLRETFQGVVQTLQLSGKLNPNVTLHADVFSMYSDSTIIEPQENQSTALKTMLLSLKASLFGFAAHLNAENITTPANKFFESAITENKIKAFLQELSALPLQSLSATSISNIGFQILYYFKLSFGTCTLEKYSIHYDKLAIDLIGQFKRLIEGNPYSHISKLIFTTFEDIMSFCDSSEFCTRIRDNINSILPLIKTSRDVEYNDASLIRNAYLDQMHIIMLYFSAMMARFNLLAESAHIKSLEQKLNFAATMAAGLGQVPANIALIQRLLDRNKVMFILGKDNTITVYNKFASRSQLDIVIALSNQLSQHEPQLHHEKVKIEKEVALLIKIYQHCLTALSSGCTNPEFLQQIETAKEKVARLQQIADEVKTPPLPAKKIKIVTKKEKPPLPKKKSIIQLPKPGEPMASKIESPQSTLCPDESSNYKFTFSNFEIIMPETLNIFFKALQEAMPMCRPVVFGEFVGDIMVQLTHPDLGLLILPKVQIGILSEDWQNVDLPKLRQIIPDLEDADFLANKYRGTFLNWKIDIYVQDAKHFDLNAFLCCRYINVNTFFLTPAGVVWDNHGYAHQDIQQKLVRFLPTITQFNEPQMLLDFIYALIKYKFNALQTDINFINKAATSLLNIPPTQLYQHFVKMFQAGMTARAFQIWLDTGVLKVLFPEVAMACGQSENTFNSYKLFFTQTDRLGKESKFDSLLLLSNIFKIAIQDEWLHSSRPDVTRWLEMKAATSNSPLIKSLGAASKAYLVQQIANRLQQFSATKVSTFAPALFGATHSAQATPQDKQINNKVHSTTAPR